MIPVEILYDQTQWLTKKMEKFIITNCGYNRLRPVRISKACRTFTCQKDLAEEHNMTINGSVKSEKIVKKKQEKWDTFRSLRGKKKEDKNRPVLPAVLMTFDKKNNPMWL